MGVNVVWQGNIKIVLKKSEIHCDCKWAHGKYSSRYIGVVNLAFAQLHAARRIILLCKNKKLKERLKNSLESAGTSGYNDMEDASKHVSDNLNDTLVWTDDEVKYASIPGWYNPKTRMHTPAVNGKQPDGPVNFLNALKSELEDQKEEWIADYFPASDAIVKGFNKNDYDGVIATLKGFNKDVDRLDKLAWMFDVDEIMEFKSIQKKLSYTKLLTGFDGALKDLEKYRSAGFSDKQSVAFLALKTAVGMVPVFGSFYQQIIDNCPILIGNFKRLCEERQRKILAVAGY